VDEAGIDDTEDYPYGYCQKGKRFYALKRGSRTQRVSMIAALNDKTLQAPMTFEGYCNADVFEAWVGQILLPTLQKSQTVILDNASFHKSQRIKLMVESVGCELLYLPPYSPDFNDMEHEWFPLKNKIRKNIPQYKSFREAVDMAFV
jgi:transposase